MTTIRNKKYTFTHMPMTIRSLLVDYYADIDVQPEGQRLETDPNLCGKSRPSKAQGIIYSLLIGMDLGTIILSKRLPPSKFAYESVDGGHRKRYIKAFFENRFPCFFTGRYYRDLTEDERNEFMDRTLNVIVYSDLDPEDNAFIFQSVNKSTDVNHQENLNAYNVIPVAKVIREVSRVVPGIDNDCHPLFDCVTKNNKTKYTYLSFDNARLRIDEMVARIFYRYYDGGGLGVSDRADLEKMYQDYPDLETMLELKKKVTKCLNFILAMGKVADRKGRQLTLKEFRIYERLYMYLESTIGSFKIVDNDSFFTAVDKAYAPFRVKYENQIKELQKPSPFDRTKTIGKQFNDSLTEYDTVAHVEFPVLMLIKRLDLRSLILDLDPARLFSHEERIAKLAEQDGLCAIDGQSLDIRDAEGAHIIAHSDGGRTTYNNLAMVRKEYNKRMGSMSVEQFKSLIS